ncbi:hypothetical protein COEREDRAFT_49424 [Coemansia reversa NRRL 1564]|uniref:Carbohydrate-binding module family 96 domain-containing protein n=1 Tax=Coemansia reversa (strain ATCC 12441 / NRRL 1564) TaxID=763665 RepID=A0A2G5B2S5_COERN|nr:hypothetical protein COEREDRAFT_49424 [Coemansia reversa NRRL 1564]|eukprot:PIA13306.1 hypothetical protein COEREDRAFT_49424 [Coemansia reversa NRRL 1564]
MLSMLLVESGNVDTPAVKDSTILRSTTYCPQCPENNCYKCTLGHNNTLVASSGGLAFLQSLVGFNMPVAATQVESCTIQIPAFLTHQYPLTVIISLAAATEWNEDTVDGSNAPVAGDIITSVDVPAYNNLGAVDISAACKAAVNGEFSIYFSAGSNRYEFWSKDSGNPAILYIITNGN